MKDIGDDALIRRYLLGGLAEGEQVEFEKRLMSDTRLFDQTLFTEDDLIEAYLEDSLSKDEREEFEASFLSTSKGAWQIIFARDLREYAAKATVEVKQSPNQTTPVSWLPPFSVSHWKFAILTIIVFGIGLGAWRLFIYKPPVSKGLIALREAYREQRPFEARISEFGYAPPPNTRGGREDVDHNQQQLAEKFLLDAVVDTPTAATHHALGEFYLAGKQFDKAIPEFQEALSADEANARLHNDMGVALLEKGKRDHSGPESGQSTEAFAESLQHFSRALEIDGSSLEALFNRALCHQYMNLSQQAQGDWQLYLEKDSHSLWADEARQHLESLLQEQKSISKSKEEVWGDFLSAYAAGENERAWKAFSQGSEREGNYIVERLLDSYLDSSLRGYNHETTKPVEMLSFAGNILNRKAGDRFVTELANFYRHTGPNQQRLLAEARAAMKVGYKFLKVPKFEAASSSFQKARQLFRQVGDECESSTAEYWLAMCGFQMRQFSESFSQFVRLSKHCENAGYQWLHVRVLSALANHQFTLNEYSKALQFSTQSYQLAQQTPDNYGLVIALSQLIEEYRYLGNYRQSLNYIHSLSALAGSSSLEPNQTWLYYSIIASAYNSMRLYATAADFQSAALNLALRLEETSMVCVSYLHLGVIYAEMQKFDEALSIARQAYEVAQHRSGEPFGRQMMAYSSLQIGNICRRAARLDEALAHYNEAVELYDDLHFPTFVYQAHKGMLLSYFAQGETSLAKEQLDITLDLDRRYRSKILEESNRNTFFDMEQDVYDLAIDFAHSRMQDDQQAFEYSEESRAKSLLDAMNSNPQITYKGREPELTFSPGSPDSATLKLVDLQSNMPEKVQMLQYAVLKDKLLIWIISRTEFKSVVQNISSDELDELVKSYLRALKTKASGESEEAIQAAKRLYDTLISPAEAFLDSGNWICIVPDKVLNYVPYNALISPSGDYLIKHFTVMLSPSSSVFLACCNAARNKKHESGENILAVSNTHVGSGKHPELGELLSAAKEAKEAAAFYHDPQVLDGTTVYIKEIMSKMEQANVLHFASHSVIDEANPMKSKLLLGKASRAPDDSPEAEGALQASEIYRLGLSAAQLVVLSACQTGIECAYRGEGAISLARPFMVRGVPLVVASLWPVDSDATTELMISFHKHRKQDGQPTIEALRSAQLEMLSSPLQHYRHPYYWASFNLIGGYAEF